MRGYELIFDKGDILRAVVVGYDVEISVDGVVKRTLTDYADNNFTYFLDSTEDLNITPSSIISVAIKAKKSGGKLCGSNIFDKDLKPVSASTTNDKNKVAVPTPFTMPTSTKASSKVQCIALGYWWDFSINYTALTNALNKDVLMNDDPNWSRLLGFQRYDGTKYITTSYVTLYDPTFVGLTQQKITEFIPNFIRIQSIGAAWTLTPVLIQIPKIRCNIISLDGIQHSYAEIDFAPEEGDTLRATFNMSAPVPVTP